MVLEGQIMMFLANYCVKSIFNLKIVIFGMSYALLFKVSEVGVGQENSNSIRKPKKYKSNTNSDQKFYHVKETK